MRSKPPVSRSWLTWIFAERSRSDLSRSSGMTIRNAEGKRMFTPTDRRVYVRWWNVVSLARSGNTQRGTGSRKIAGMDSPLCRLDAATGLGLGTRGRRRPDSTAWMLSTGGNISDGAATPLEWSVWTAEKPADDIRDLREHCMTSSPANPRELTGAQAPPPSRRRGCLRYIAIDCIPDFAPPTTELSAGDASPSALKCGAKFAALWH